jgi:hypothetical protein
VATYNNVINHFLRCIYQAIEREAPLLKTATVPIVTGLLQFAGDTSIDFTIEEKRTTSIAILTIRGKRRKRKVKHIAH